MQTVDYSRIKSGDMIIINDADTISRAIAQGVRGIVLGMPVSVIEVECIHDSDTGLECYNIKLDNNTYMFLFAIGGNVDCYINRVPDWYQAGTRSDLLNLDQKFLFEPPEDPNNFEVGSLNIASQITMEIEGEDHTLNAIIPTIYGENQDGKLASVSLLSCNELTTVVLDYGEDDSWIEFYEGYHIDIEQVEFLIK